MNKFDSYPNRWLLCGLLAVTLSLSSYLMLMTRDEIDIGSLRKSASPTSQQTTVIQPYERDVAYYGRIPLATVNKPHDKPTVLDTHLYSIVVCSYKRLDFLREFLETYISSPRLDRIFVVWNDVDNWPPPDYISNISDSQIFFHRPEKNSMNNRFRPFNEMRTEAVILLDDDVRVSLDSISFLFESWHAIGRPFALLGFLARSHKKIAEGRWSYSYSADDGHSIILVGASLFPYASLHSYTYELPQSARDKVDAVFNCDDLLFNFMMANITDRPPILVSGALHQKPVEGISTKTDHMAKRNGCLKYYIEEEFGGVDPLKWGKFSISRNGKTSSAA